MNGGFFCVSEYHKTSDKKDNATKYHPGHISIWKQQ